jgi:predicted esterase
MAGYGAYRIFYEYPKLFKAVAVFSGHPNLAGKWIGPGHPDFLQPGYLKPFKTIPVFIYHSKNDLNCPFDLTLKLVQKLKDAGARVEFVTSEQSGHGILDKDHTQGYNDWLGKVITP